MSFKILLVLIPFSLIWVGCSLKESGQLQNPNDLSGGAVSVTGTRFTDISGRQIIFNGINYVNKDSKLNYISKDSESTFELFRKWGFNCVRLGVIWAGAEPEPGKYDENYLGKIEEQVKWATQNGLYVFLDMHQDLFSSKFSDGAPLWATLTEGKPHVVGAIWSDSYFLSQAVQQAFDNFWINKPASDGVGIQDHYAKLWQHIAKRFARNRTIIGYDIMNEPFNGSSGTQILPVILTEYAKIFAEETGKVLSEREVMAIWSDEESRIKALGRLENIAKYSRVIRASTELSQQFEKTTLQSMYQRVANAIREVDSDHILFLEHAYFSNAGVCSGIMPVTGKNGSNDPQVAYAAHGYDLLVDSKSNDNQSCARVAWIFSQISETSKRINVPVLVGEWGAFGGNSKGAAVSAQFIKEQFDNYHFGSTYWAYYEGIEKCLYFKTTFGRPSLQYVGGILKSNSFSPETNVLKCSWDESPEVKLPTVIYISDLRNFIKESIRLFPAGSNAVIKSAENSNHGYLIIPVTGKPVERKLEFKLRSDHSSISIDGNYDLSKL